MSTDNIMISSLKKLQAAAMRLKGRAADRQFAPVREVEPFAAGKSTPEDLLSGLSGSAVNANGLKDSFGETADFDFASLLRLRSFLYLLAGTVVFLFQINNTLSIINLARENERLREQIQMTTSVITAQELKVHELHSIHNIVQTAEALGLMASCEPSVKLVK
ncbi:MAG: hypothetical protein HGB23_01155 [Chlorobiaceae bacterium]|nr:hypothetical protein [Chlorobiaceae bacterium]